jgi:hypothetical protein
MLEHRVLARHKSRQSRLLNPFPGEFISFPVHALPIPRSCHANVRLTTRCEEAPDIEFGFSHPSARKLHNDEEIQKSIREHTGCWMHFSLHFSRVTTFCPSSPPIFGHAPDRDVSQDNPATLESCSRINFPSKDADRYFDPATTF